MDVRALIIIIKKKQDLRSRTDRDTHLIPPICLFPSYECKKFGFNKVKAKMLHSFFFGKEEEAMKH
jgi:hypothetical protein